MFINILHSFVNFFAGGRSEIKTILFFLYLTLLIFLFIFFREVYFKRIKWVWFITSLFLMYLYGFLLHLFYFLSNNLKITDFIITGNNGEISSSIFSHIHISKVVIGQVFSFFGKNQFQTLDAGGAYINIFPSWIILGGSFLLTILIFQALYYFISYYKIFLINKNKRQKIFLIIIYGILSFSLIKTSIDGGIFSPSFILGLIFIIILIFREKQKDKIININFYYIAIYFGIILILFNLYFSPSVYYNFSVSITSLFLLYTFILYMSEEKINSKMIFFILILFIAGWWQTGIRDRELNEYSKIPLNIGQKIYTYDQINKDVVVLKVENIESVGVFTRKLNKNLTYLPVAIPGITCMEKSKPENLYFTLVSDLKPPKDMLSHSNFLEIKNKNSILFKNKWYTDVNVLIDPCTPEILSVIDGFLYKNNIKKYLIINPLSYDLSDN